jgi:hypothetical protein
MRLVQLLLAGSCLLAGCSSDKLQAPRPDEFKIIPVAAASATNTCIEAKELSAIIIRLQSRKPSTKLAFNRMLVGTIKK